MPKPATTDIVTLLVVGIPVTGADGTNSIRVGIISGQGSYFAMPIVKSGDAWENQAQVDIPIMDPNGEVFYEWATPPLPGWTGYLYLSGWIEDVTAWP